MATSKNHENNGTKISGNIAAVAFVTKKKFSLPTGHVFFLRLYLAYSPIAAVLC
jgi:hypothetical protein